MNIHQSKTFAGPRPVHPAIKAACAPKWGGWSTTAFLRGTVSRIAMAAGR